MNEIMEKATFAAGCFWGVQATFLQLEGVIKTQVGYAGGHKINPSYKDVGSDITGHAEALEITFDPETLSYKELADIFFRLHDPTQLNRQGPDIGSQYRSVIFYHTPEQKKVAEEIKIKFQNSEKYRGRKIVTEIIPASKFYRAEEYHQRYFEKNGFHACVNFLPLPIKKR
jgi:peptide-methionine (S)-S-oxide reductase